ncbi:MAG: hypothetical protein QOE23_2807 [Pseudonocardiales bacterium]|jgi:hypothetical protein|nr:hypothetical protein [Pseudonocardiales bacterium]
MNQPIPLASSPPGPRPETATASTGLPGRRQAGTRIAAGVALLLLAVVLFGGSRVVAAGQRHAYDPGASPPASYALTAGTTYQLSSARSVAELKAAGLLSDLTCFLTSGTGEQLPLSLASTADDDRNLHVFATLVAPSTARVHLSCTGIADVFVDDADSAGPDRSAVLLLASIGAGLVGVITACSGGYAAADRPAGHRSERRATVSAEVPRRR